MQFSTILSVAFLAVSAYARTDCTADANYCGWNLISKGYQGIDAQTLYFCSSPNGDVIPLNTCRTCEGPTAHCVN